MRYYKLCVIMFIISLITLSANTEARHQLQIAEAKLPTGNRYFGSEIYEKTISSKQYYESTATVSDTFPYANIRGVSVVTYNADGYGTSRAITVENGHTATWQGSSDEINIIPGNYQVRIYRLPTSLISSASHWGTWYLDDYFINN